MENLLFVVVIFTKKKEITKIQSFGLRKIVRQQLQPLITWLSNRAAKTIDTTDQNKLAIVVCHKNVCDKNNHPPVKTDEIDKLHYVMNLKNRVANEIESIQAIQEEQNKFIEAKAGSLDLNQVSKLFPQFTEIQSSLYKQRYKNTK